MRGQFLGRIADYELAEAQADAMVRDAPTDGLASIELRRLLALNSDNPDYAAQLARILG